MAAFYERVKKLSSRQIYGLVALLSLAFMIWKGNDFSFWVDEFAQICYSGLDNTLLDSMGIIDPTPPLFNVVANIWYDIVPYGQRWLLLLPQLATVLAVYVSALWAERLGGKSAGVWTAILLGSSRMVIAHCGFEFRSYGFYILFAALTLYYHDLVLEKDGEALGRVGLYYGLSLTCLSYSHLFGCLMFLVIAAQDVLLMLGRRMSWKRIFIYFFAGLPILPWGFNFLRATGLSVLSPTNQWMPPPMLLDIAWRVAYFCGNHWLVCIFFAVGTLFVLAEVVTALRRKDNCLVHFRRMVPLFTMAGTLLFVFAYGKIRPENHSMWVTRYFTGLIPATVLVAGFGASRLGAWLHKRQPRAAVAAAVLAFLLIVPNYLGRVMSGDLPMVRYFYRESTEVMYQQPDIHDEDTLVLCSMGHYEEGWEEYYCQQKGRREPLGIRPLSSVTVEELLEYEVVYYDCNHTEAYIQDHETRLALLEMFELDTVWEDVYLRRYVKK